MRDGFDVVKVHQKGADGIVHVKCRKTYTNKKQLKVQQQSKAEAPKRSARVTTGPFNSKTDCLFCGTTITHGTKDTRCVKSDSLVESILF